MRAEIWGWLLSWVLSLAAAALCMAAAFKLVDILWWKPKRIEEHFAKQGIRGPPYRFFIGNLREMVSLMLEASSKPMSPKNSHNILPRVLSFYHHWKKIYGMVLCPEEFPYPGFCALSPYFFFFFFFFFFRIATKFYGSI